MSDSISRVLAAKSVCEACNKQFGDEPCEPAECLILQALHDVPDFDDKEPEAYWITRMGSYCTPRCSNCGWSIPYCEDCGGLEVRKHCPNCGKKMEEKTRYEKRPSILFE